MEKSPLGGGAAGALGAAAGAGGGAWGVAGVWLALDARRTSMRHVGQVCCLWNQERRQLGEDERGMRDYDNMFSLDSADQSNHSGT